MEHDTQKNDEGTFKDFALGIIGEGLAQFLFGLMFTTSIGLFFWVGIWSIVLLIPIGFTIYYFFNKPSEKKVKNDIGYLSNQP